MPTYSTFEGGYIQTEPEELTNTQLKILLQRLNLPTSGRTKVDFITTLQFATVTQEELEKVIEEILSSDLKSSHEKGRKSALSPSPSRGKIGIASNESSDNTRDAFFAPHASDFQKYQEYVDNQPKRFSQNAYNIRRYYEFRIAAYYLAREFSGLAIVQKVAIIGSVARPLIKEPPHFKRSGSFEWHYCDDLDLAVWFNAPVNREILREIQKKRVAGLSRLTSEMKITFAHHQVEIFCFDLSDHYLGRLCLFNDCPKSGKQECFVVNCGKIPLLQQHHDFHFNPQSIATDQIIEIYSKF